MSPLNDEPLHILVEFQVLQVFLLTMKLFPGSLERMQTALGSSKAKDKPTSHDVKNDVEYRIAAPAECNA